MIKECCLIEPLVCKKNDSIIDVAKKLREHLLRYIYVVDEKDSPVGVISTTDMNNRIVAEGKDPNSIVAKDIMSTPVYCFEEDEDEKEAYKQCVKNKISTCAVTKDKKIVGIVSIHELLREITRVD